MDRELSYMILLPISSLLFMVGGWRHKWIRRYLLPMIFVLTCLVFNQSAFGSWTLGVLACISFSLPYGENSSWVMRTATAISFGLVGIPLGINWFMMLPPVVFLLGWIISNRFKLQWKIVEGLTGFCIALPIANRLYHG